MTLAWQVQKGVQRTALLRLNADARRSGSNVLIISQVQSAFLRKVESSVPTPDLGAGAGTDEEPEPDTHRGSEVVCGVAQVPCRVSLSPRTCIRNKTGR